MLLLAGWPFSSWQKFTSTRVPAVSDQLSPTTSSYSSALLSAALPGRLSVDRLPELQFIQPAVRAEFLHQLFVRANVADGAVFEHHDAVGAAHGRKPVRDHKHGTPTIRFCRADCTSDSDSLSSAEVASSRIRIGAFFRMARAMAMRWRSPPESRRPRSPIMVS